MKRSIVTALALAALAGCTVSTGPTVPVPEAPGGGVTLTPGDIGGLTPLQPKPVPGPAPVVPLKPIPKPIPGPGPVVQNF